MIHSPSGEWVRRMEMTKYEREQVFGAIDTLKSFLLQANKIGAKDQQKIMNELIVLKNYIYHVRD